MSAAGLDSSTEDFRSAELLALAREMGLVSAGRETLGELSQRTIGDLEAELAHRRAEARKALRDDLPAGGKYELGVLLGAGGMGRVVRAFDPRLRRPLALKFLLRDDPQATARALHEAQAQARVEHPHVCKVYEAGETDGRPYIAMQLVDGKTLLAAARDMTLEQKMRVLAQVAGAVHFAHGQGLVHRDLKPGNVLVERRADGSWHPYVTDFGVARDLDAPTTMSDGPVGTPQFMAPEQAAGQPVDRRVDVYSLGAMLYTLLVGRPPFAGTLFEVLKQLAERDPLAPRRLVHSVPRDLETIALKCLTRAPEGRYASAREVEEELGRWLRGEPIRARPLGLPARLLRRARRHPAALAVASAALIALAAVGGSWLEARRQGQRQAELGELFGREAARIEGQMHTALILPLHDTRADRAALQGKLRAIEAQMNGLGPIADGPGHYALGRGALALRSYDEARRHLERAWAAGYRTASTAQALGETLGAIYEREASVAERLPAPAERAAILARLSSELREPAVRFLRQAPAEAPLAGARLAFYGQELDEAERLAERAAREVPTPYEPMWLLAEIELRRARAQHDLGRFDEALAAYQAAGPLLARAAEIARSDAEVALAECRRSSALAALLPLRGGTATEAVAGALAACGRAVTAAPDLAAAHAQKVSAYEWAAYDAVDRGNDPRALVAAGLAAGQAAIALAPGHDLPYAQVAALLRVLGSYETDHGRDPAAIYAQAIAMAARARDLNPRSAYAWHQLGKAMADLARQRRNLGQRGDAMLLNALFALEQATAIDPRYVWVVNELARALQDAAVVAHDAGVPWRASIDRCAALMREVLARSPRAQPSRMRLGLCLATAAPLALDDDEDAGLLARQAITALGGALELRPNDRVALRFLGRAHAVLARSLARAGGGDPRPEWDAARELAGRALAVKPDYPEPRLDIAEADRRQAEWLLATGDPGAALALAAAGRAHAREAAPALGATPALPRALAALALAEGDAARALGRSPAAAWREAEAQIARALALRPADAAALALRADLARRRQPTDLTRRKPTREVRSTAR